MHVLPSWGLMSTLRFRMVGCSAAFRHGSSVRDAAEKAACSVRTFIFRFALASSLALTTVVLVSAPAGAAQSAQVFNVPFTVTAGGQADIAACVGEEVVFTDGQFNVVIRETETHFVFHRNVVAGLGIGEETGTVYRATGHLQMVDVLPSSGGETFTFELTLNVVGMRNAGQFTAHAVDHLTFTPQGDLTSAVEIFGIRCR